MKHVMEMVPDGDKTVMDIISFWALAGVFAEFLPVFVLFLTAVWTMLRIYETPTVQGLVHRNKKENDDGEDA